MKTYFFYELPPSWLIRICKKKLLRNTFLCDFEGVSKKFLHFPGALDCLLCSVPYISLLVPITRQYLTWLLSFMGISSKSQANLREIWGKPHANPGMYILKSQSIFSPNHNQLGPIPTPFFFPSRALHAFWHMQWPSSLLWLADWLILMSSRGAFVPKY